MRGIIGTKGEKEEMVRWINRLKKLSDWRQFSNNVDETHIYLEREPTEPTRSHVQQERDPCNEFGQIDNDVLALRLSNSAYFTGFCFSS